MPPPRRKDANYLVPILSGVGGVALLIGLIVMTTSSSAPPPEPEPVASAPVKKTPLVASALPGTKPTGAKPVTAPSRSTPGSTPIASGRNPVSPVPNPPPKVVVSPPPIASPPAIVDTPKPAPVKPPPIVKPDPVKSDPVKPAPVKADPAKVVPVKPEPLAPPPADPASPTGIIEHRFAADVQPLMEKYCYGCHANGKHKGDVSLDKYTTLYSIQNDHGTWETLLDEISSSSMPPEDKPQPTKAELAVMTSFVEQALTFRDCSGPRDPGRVTIRRLNKVEYNNTMRDLLGVDFKPAADFPSDDSGYGFDNIADVLSMSPLLAEKYLAAAEQVLDKAIVTDPPKRQAIRIDGAKLTSTAGGVAADSAWTLSANGELYVKQAIDLAGDYEIRIRAYGTQVAPDPVKMTVRIDGAIARNFDVKATKDAPATLLVPATLRAGERRIGVAFINELVNKNIPTKPVIRTLTIESITIDGPKNSAQIPLPPPTEAQKRLIFATPGKDGTEADCARKILQRFATRAFRRPTTPQEITRLMTLFDASRKEGDSFPKAVKFAMTATLVSPHFLFRIEPNTGQTSEKVYPISEFALASRLSYFLWSTMPDEELFTAAAAGKLRQPGAMEAEVKRMMADPKAQAFVANFAGQWLELRILDDYEPDPKKFPAFTAKLRSDMKQEAEMFFQGLVNEDRSILEVINSNYTFLNERLAKFYKIPGVTGENFRKVTLDSSMHRGGVLTMASVLTVTAMPSRTSPVKRGKYILDQILGSPPPPPPADVPALSDKKKDLDSASMRQRLEAHRADPTCASCHKRMDPIGFALENYDAIGEWRDKEGTFAIDPSGVLPGGRKIDGPESLKKALLDKKDDFVRCVVTKMLTYAIGRGTEPYDRCTVEDICDTVKQNNYKFSGIVLGIVKSDAFQKRRAE